MSRTGSRSGRRWKVSRPGSVWWSRRRQSEAGEQHQQAAQNGRLRRHGGKSPSPVSASACGVRSRCSQTPPAATRRPGDMRPAPGRPARVPGLRRGSTARDCRWRQRPRWRPSRSARTCRPGRPRRLLQVLDDDLSACWPKLPAWPTAPSGRPSSVEASRPMSMLLERGVTVERLHVDEQVLGGRGGAAAARVDVSTTGRSGTFTDWHRLCSSASHTGDGDRVADAVLLLGHAAVLGEARTHELAAETLNV